MDLYLSGICVLCCVSSVLFQLSKSHRSSVEQNAIYSFHYPLVLSCPIKIVVSRPSSDLILQLLSSLIPPAQVLFFLNHLCPAAISLYLSAFCQSPLSRLVHFTLFLAFWPFLPPHVLKTPLLFHVPLTFTAFTWDNFQSRKLFTLMLPKVKLDYSYKKTRRRLNIL